MWQVHHTMDANGLPGTFFRISGVKSYRAPTEYHLHYGTERQMQVLVPWGTEAEFEESMTKHGPKTAGVSDQTKYHWYGGSIHEEEPKMFNDPRTCDIRVTFKGESVLCSSKILTYNFNWFRGADNSMDLDGGVKDDGGAHREIPMDFPVSFQTLRHILSMYHQTDETPLITTGTQLKDLFAAGRYLGVVRWCSLVDYLFPEVFNTKIDPEIVQECREPLLLTYERDIDQKTWRFIHFWYARGPVWEYAVMSPEFFLLWWKHMPPSFFPVRLQKDAEAGIVAWFRNHRSMNFPTYCLLQHDVEGTRAISRADLDEILKEGLYKHTGK